MASKFTKSRKGKMVFKSLKYIFFASILVCSTSINAAPINFVPNGSYTTDTDNDLDWLKLLYTSGVSYNDAIGVASTVAGGGWRYATNTEMTVLYSQLFSGLPESATTVYGPPRLAQIDDFTSVFNRSSLNVNTEGTISLGMYEDENGVLRPGGVVNINISDGDNSYIVGLSNSNSWETLREDGTPNASTFLVRSSVVPLPASVWLFGSGLIGLVGIARRKKA